MTYKIVVQYVDFPMGASPEYTEHSKLSKEEAELKVKELRELADKNSPNNACNYPVYTIKEEEWDGCCVECQQTHACCYCFRCLKHALPLCSGCSVFQERR